MSLPDVFSVDDRSLIDIAIATFAFHYNAVLFDCQHIPIHYLFINKPGLDEPLLESSPVTFYSDFPMYQRINQ